MLNRVSVFFSTLLYCWLLSGCASFEPIALNPADSAQGLENRSLKDPNLNLFIQQTLGETSSNQSQTWTLDKLTLAAIYFNPEIRVARAQFASTHAAIQTAAQKPNPNILSTFTYVTHFATTTAPWIIINTAYIPIETAGKRDYRTQRAQHLSDAANLRIKEVVWMVRAKLRAGLLEYFSAQQALDLAEKQLALQQKINQLLEQQLSVGEISLLDIAHPRLTLGQMQLNVHAAEKRFAESKVQLATVIGLPLQGIEAAVFHTENFRSPPDLKGVPLRQFRKVALQNRPDILAALADYEAAQSALQLEIANQYPNLQASPGYNWELGANYWVLGGYIMQLPVFNKNEGQIAEATARRKEQADRFQALQMKVIGDVERAGAGIDAVMDKWMISEQQRQTESNNMREIQANYENGEIDQVALLTAQQASLNTERTQLDVLVESHMAFNSLEDSLRQPLDSALNTILSSDLTAVTSK